MWGEMWLYLNFQAHFHFYPEIGFDKMLLFGMAGVVSPPLPHEGRRDRQEGPLL